jgi:hypothetical protein
MIRILENEVPFVRIIEHGLKNRHFYSFLELVEIVENRSNRIDFGVTVNH